MGPFSVQLQLTSTPPSVSVPYYALEIVALAAVNMSKKVFVYRRTDAGTDVFDGVASPVDLLLIPEDTPDEESTYPTKFRSDTYEKMSAQPTDISEARDGIQESVDKLTRDLQTAWDTSATEIVFAGEWGAGHSTNSLLAV